jgi:hypothetical protein
MKLIVNQAAKKHAEDLLPCSQKCAIRPDFLSELKPVNILPITSLRTIFIVFSHVCLGLSNRLFTRSFPTRIYDRGKR